MTITLIAPERCRSAAAANASSSSVTHRYPLTELESQVERSPSPGDHGDTSAGIGGPGGHRETDRARSQHRHRGARSHGDPGQRVNRDRGAVEERALVVADLRRQPEDVRRRGEAELRKAARPRDAEVLEVWAERSAATPARAAGSAGDHRLHGNPISRHDVLDAGPDRSDLTGELVPLRGARIRRQIELRAGAVLVQVPAADARRTHANDDFVGPGDRIGKLLEPEVARAGEDRSKHGGALYRVRR